MFRLLPGLCALVLLLGSGIVHRLWTGAWSVSNEPAASAARLEKLPMTIGDWEGQDMAIDRRQLEVAEIVGHISRRYVQRGTGKEVTLLLVCGRPGPICVHTPNVCFRGAGYELIGETHRYNREAGEDTPAAEFIQATMSKPGRAGVPQRLRVYWAWKYRDPWSAPSWQRIKFGSAPALYKLYLVYYLPDGTEPTAKDPCQDFLPDLLPALEKALAPAA